MDFLTIKNFITKHFYRQVHKEYGKTLLLSSFSVSMLFRVFQVFQLILLFTILIKNLRSCTGIISYMTQIYSKHCKIFFLTMITLLTQNNTMVLLKLVTLSNDIIELTREPVKPCEPSGPGGPCLKIEINTRQMISKSVKNNNFLPFLQLNHVLHSYQAIQQLPEKEYRDNVKAETHSLKEQSVLLI